MGRQWKENDCAFCMSRKQVLWRPFLLAEQKEKWLHECVTFPSADYQLENWKKNFFAWRIEKNIIVYILSWCDRLLMFNIERIVFYLFREGLIFVRNKWGGVKGSWSLGFIFFIWLTLIINQLLVLWRYVMRFVLL